MTELEELIELAEAGLAMIAEMEEGDDD